MLETADLVNEVRRWLLVETGRRATRMERLAGGASERAYIRVLFEDGESVVVMVRPVVRRHAEHGATTRQGSAFEVVGTWLQGQGVRVPGIVAKSIDERMLALEDLGDVRLFDRVATASATQRLKWYREAVSCLADFQRHCWRSQAPALVTRRELDRRAVLAELDEFRDMGLVARHSLVLTPAETTIIDHSWQRIADGLANVPQRVAHRDFQSQNLMVVARELVIIDFQDAFMAPWTYDLVALLRDSYVELSADDVETLLDDYLAQWPGPVGERPPSRSELGRVFRLQTVQRKLKDAGRFETLERRGKTGFLRYYPASLRYVVAALSGLDGLEALLELLQTHVPESR